MKHGFFLLLCIAAMYLQASARPQEEDFDGRLKEQQEAISNSYRADKITRIEYNKLMHEQDVIKDLIKTFKADGDFTITERDTVFKKLQKADERLAKYSEK